MLQHVTALDNQVIVLVVFEDTYVYACDPLDSLISGIYTVCTSELCAYKRFCLPKLISVSRRRLVWRSHDASAALVIINHFKADHFLSRRTKGSIRLTSGFARGVRLEAGERSVTCLMVTNVLDA